ncbi:MAG: prepilin-type N-terminal cleavage/methylation domain-containing protein [Candidatus Omnitrophica bacterium]|nr:prepilin-type N-terminal cleavage/methylation domain-containing protein [Candidatus Omnitrophota bacterium]MCB9747463.1 prepilin-type N-terminal cleavage/methylation domain-containing protein [Candidatus Omnitrophota bacterium]
MMGKIKICRIKTKQAFSLVEMMVTMVIFSILLGGLYASAAVGEKAWDVNAVKVELHQELRKAMEWMIYDLRQAGQASITNVPSDGAWYTTITFKSASGVTAGTIDWDANSTQFVRGGTGNAQLQRIRNGVTKVLALDLSSLQFRRQAGSPNVLEVALAAQKSTTKGISVQYNLDFNVQLRN